MIGIAAAAVQAHDSLEMVGAKCLQWLHAGVAKYCGVSDAQWVVYNTVNVGTCT